MNCAEKILEPTIFSNLNFVPILWLSRPTSKRNWASLSSEVYDRVNVITYGKLSGVPVVNENILIKMKLNTSNVFLSFIVC